MTIEIIEIVDLPIENVGLPEGMNPNFPACSHVFVPEMVKFAQPSWVLMAERGSAQPWFSRKKKPEILWDATI
jgi:hypothetical protein